MGARRLLGPLVALTFGLGAATLHAQAPTDHASDAADHTDATEATDTDTDGNEAPQEPSTPPKPPAPEPPESPALRDSKRLFQEAQQVRKEAGCTRAVPLYLASRKAHPALSNTLNAAICLEQLERGDEALPLYQALLEEQAGRLDPKQAAALEASVARLTERIGRLTIVGGADGAAVVIDGRRRGTLPLSEPLPVFAGTRELRVIKEGHESFVSAVDVVVGDALTVEALTPLLTRSGRLQVASTALTGGELRVDGAPVGTVPWSGRLAPGRYVLQVTHWDRGTAPQEVTIVAGQTAELDLDASPLGPEIVVVTDPPGAALSLGPDELPLGTARWRGRLPVGTWVFRASEEGYVGGATTFESRVDGRRQRVTVSLAIDETHPRWAVDGGLSLTFALSALGGPALAPAVGGASASCDADSCSRNALGIGGLAGLRGGVELPFGLSIELLGGYLGLSQDVDRSTARTFETSGGETVPTGYTIFNRLRMHGGFVAAGVGYQLVLADPLELRLGAAFGAAFLRVRDDATGDASAGGGISPVDVAGSGEAATNVDLLVLPEVALGVRLDAFWIGAGVSVPVLLLGGPEQQLSDAFVRGTCDPASDATAVACAPGQALFDGETLYDPMAVVVPMVQVGYRFE